MLRDNDQDGRPFHETIVDAIREATGTEMHCLARLIKRTVIPKDHGRISAAWQERCRVVFGPTEDLGVMDVLRAKETRVLSRVKD